MRLGNVCWALALGASLAGSSARAFTVLDFAQSCAPEPTCGPGAALDVRGTLEAAPRWPAAPRPGSSAGLHDGIQVAIPTGFAAAFAPTLDRVAEMEAAVDGAFAAWETPELRFDLRRDTTGSLRGGGGPGLELDLFLGRSGDSSFGGPGYVGITFFSGISYGSRALTNGSTLPGYAITDMDIAIATDRFAGFFDLLVASDIAMESDRAARLQNLLMHEIGHALGLGHPNESPWANVDSDFDPLTRIAVDPSDPFAGLHVSAAFDPNTIMRGTSPPDPRALLYTSLRADDLSGRDVLYPSRVPEPGTVWLVAAGLLALARYAPRTIRR